MREMKAAEEKWILNNDAEPHTEWISEGFLLDWSGILALKNKIKKINNHLFTYISATRPPVTRT